MVDQTHAYRAYHAYLTRRSPISLLVRRAFVADLARHFHGQVLDVGCGIGEFLDRYRPSAGLDPNPLLVAHCRQRGHHCWVAVAESLPLVDGSFDGVLISNVLEHLAAPEVAVREARRVLRAQGVLVVTVPLEAGFRHDPTHVRMVTADDIHDLAQGCGLRVARLYQYPVGGNWAGKHLYFSELRAVLVRDAT